MNFIKTYKQTILICLLNFAIFIVLSLTESYYDHFRLYFAVWTLKSGLFSPYQLITYQFVHIGLSHLLINMLFLSFLAGSIEKTYKRNLIFDYIFFGVIGGLFHLHFDYLNLPMVGASGSVFGFTALYLLTSGNNFFSVVYNKTFLFILVFIEIWNICIVDKDLIAHWCHVGGAIAGFLIWLSMFKKEKNEPKI